MNMYLSSLGLFGTLLDGFSEFQLAAAFAAVFFAGALRAFSGFGFALAGVPLLAFLFGPVVAVPVVLVLEVLSGATMLPIVRRHVDWRSVGLLVPAALVAAPLGLYLLSALPPEWLKLVIAGVMIGAVTVIAGGFSLPAAAPRSWLFGVGGVSGLLAGGTAMAGPPILIYFLARDVTPSAKRASMLTYFFFVSIGTVAVGVASGIVAPSTIWLAVLLSPALVLSNVAGHWLFERASEAHYKHVSLALVATIAFATAVDAASGLFLA